MSTQNIPDGDYDLSEGRAWLGTTKFSIRVMETGEGVVVDIYGRGQEDQSPIASTWAHENDIEEPNEHLAPAEEPHAAVPRDEVDSGVRPA